MKTKILFLIGCILITGCASWIYKIYISLESISEFAKHNIEALTNIENNVNGPKYSMIELKKKVFCLYEHHWDGDDEYVRYTETIYNDCGGVGNLECIKGTVESMHREVLSKDKCTKKCEIQINV